MNYIAVEGINGCGKTTLVKEMQQYYDPNMTNMPSDSIATVKFPINHAQLIEIKAFQSNLADHTPRDTELENEYLKMETRYHNERMSMFDLYQQSGSNRALVTDRSFISSWVYSRAMCMESAAIDKLHEVEHQSHQLAGVIFIDISPKIAFRRVERRDNAIFTLEMLNNIRHQYVQFFNHLWNVPVLRITDGQLSEDNASSIVRTCLQFVRKLC